MSETGWPLIPRELLPAPVKRVRSPRPAPDQHASTAGRQLSIFGAETTEPSPADLAGLLAGPGRLERMGGTARVSIPVDAAWRVHVLMNELVRRGLVVSWQPIARTPEPPTGAPGPARDDAAAARSPSRHTRPPAGSDVSAAVDVDFIDYDADWADEPASAVIGGGGASGVPADTAEAESRPPGMSESAEGEPDDPGAADAMAAEWRRPEPLFEVRTAYSSRLNGLARSWPEAAGGLFLDGPPLRLWVAAAGYPVEDGVRLGLAAGQDPAMAEAALVRAGLAGSVSDDRRSYLIIGERRLARLAELVGQRPPEAPAEAWPGGVPA